MLTNYKEILEKSQRRVLELATDVLKAYNLAVEAFVEEKLEKANEARALLKDSHNRNSKIDNEIIKTLALFSPEARDLRVVIAYLKIASELTRISDYVRSFAKKVKMQISGEVELSTLRDDMNSFLESTRKSLQAAVESIEAESEDKLENLYRKVNVEESKCDDIISILEKNILQQICVNPEDAEDMVAFIKSIRKLERISDRSVNIVKLTYFAHKGGKLKL
jgi:phosphate transport system protein